MKRVCRQLLVQLRERELLKSKHLLAPGKFGLELGEFASPKLLDGDCSEVLKTLRYFLEECKIPLSMHGPFIDLSPASPDPKVRQLTGERYRQALEIAGLLQAKFIVFHSQFNSNIPELSYREKWLKGNLTFWQELLSIAEATDVSILLENMWDPGPDVLIDLVDAINHPRLKVCFDVAHANIFSPVPASRWVEQLGDRLAYVHLSDNHGRWDEHLQLGTGNIDFVRLFQAIDAQGLSPWFVLEVPTLEQAMASIQHLRDCQIVY